MRGKSEAALKDYSGKSGLKFGFRILGNEVCHGVTPKVKNACSSELKKSFD